MATPLGSRASCPAARALLAAIFFTLLASACGGSSDSDGAQGSERPFAASFSAEVDHPLVPLSSVSYTVLEGNEGETELRIESRVQDRTARVAGVPVAVVEVKDFEDGELVERTLDYYAQRDDGSVWYFGEHVDDYEAGKIVGHEGQWLAGRDGARAGLFMPGEPAVGRRFEQERAPGIAEDRSTVVAVGVDLATPAGRFSDCIKTRDYAPLDKVTEFKHYCPDVGLVREDGPGLRVQLVRYR